MLNNFISRVAVTVKAPPSERKLFNKYAGDFRDRFSMIHGINAQADQDVISTNLAKSSSDQTLGIPHIYQSGATYQNNHVNIREFINHEKGLKRSQSSIFGSSNQHFYK